MLFPGGGFTTGWLYWYFWAMIVGIEAMVGAQLLQNWMDMSTWQLGTILMVLMAAVRLCD
tara:strand:+ start:2660 stop:2839 length:180 start_codon:yes stop_codon:yes gene_type:complete